MENTELMNKPKKASLVKNAAWSVASEILLIFIYLFLLLKPKLIFIPNDYLADALVSMAACISLVIFAIIYAIVAISQTWHTEKQDEMSKLHKYKAGYISKYICIVAIVIAVWIIKDFSFAFTGDLFTKISPIIIVYAFSQLTENIIFIILEKCNLE